VLVPRTSGPPGADHWDSKYVLSAPWTAPPTTPESIFPGQPQEKQPAAGPGALLQRGHEQRGRPRTIPATRLDTRIAPRQGREARPVAHRMASFHRATPGPHPPTRRMGEAEGTRVPRSVSEFSPVLRSSIADESVRTCLARQLRPATAWGSCSPETGMLIFPRKRGAPSQKRRERSEDARGHCVPSAEWLLHSPGSSTTRFIWAPFCGVAHCVSAEYLLAKQHLLAKQTLVCMWGASTEGKGSHRR
jgi:hypothetical protein